MCVELACGESTSKRRRNPYSYETDVASGVRTHGVRDSLCSVAYGAISNETLPLTASPGPGAYSAPKSRASTIPSTRQKVP